MSLDEFSIYLENVVMCPEILIITGDFNFHENYSTNSDANTFTELLETFGLLQYKIISLPTHVSGHILDLVITRSSDDICICSIHISSLRISDHNFVHAKFSITRPHLSVEKVKFRKIKQINGESFKSDLKASDLCTTSRSNLDDMVKCYDETMTDLLESHAPLKINVIVVRPRVPWFSEELKCVISKRRKQERKLLKTGSKCDRDAYRCVCSQYSALLKKAKGLHYTDQCSGDSKKLFRILNLLCEGNQTNPLPPHTGPYQLANDFGDFFYKKIECIKKSIDRIEVSRSQPILERGSSLDIKLASFVPMSINDVHNSIMTSSSASCKLDPITTRLPKRCSSEIAPVITKMINLSFPYCHFSGSWKIAHVNPLLKRCGLDAEFANFRSVNNLSFVFKTTEKAAVNQLFAHCESCALLPTNQSAHCKFHSTETALFRVQGDEHDGQT